MNMVEVDLDSLDLRYAKLRARRPALEKRLMASLGGGGRGAGFGGGPPGTGARGRFKRQDRSVRGHAVSVAVCARKRGRLREAGRKDHGTRVSQSGGGGALPALRGGGTEGAKPQGGGAGAIFGGS